MKIIIFDLGRVLIDFDHTIAAKRVADFSSKTQSEVFQFFFDSELTGLFEEGKISPQDFFSEVKKAIGLKLTYEEFLPIWNEIFFLSETNRKVYQLAKSLKKKYRVALLSNINILHFDYLKNKFPVFDVFDHLLLSFELKLKKPDPKIFKKILKILKVSPEEIFYTDDRPELIEEARAAGIKGFVFKDFEQLVSDLKSCRVIVE